jgi:hypothetical protein
MYHAVANLLLQRNITRISRPPEVMRCDAQSPSNSSLFQHATDPSQGLFSSLKTVPDGAPNKRTSFSDS